MLVHLSLNRDTICFTMTNLACTFHLISLFHNTFFLELCSFCSMPTAAFSACLYIVGNLFTGGQELTLNSPF